MFIPEVSSNVDQNKFSSRNPNPKPQPQEAETGLQPNRSQELCMLGIELALMLVKGLEKSSCPADVGLRER